MKGKIKIMKTRPHTTEEEIKAFMDFDALLKQKDRVLGRQRKFRRIGTVLIGSLLALTFSILTFPLLREGQQSKSLPSQVEVSRSPFALPADADTLTEEVIAQEKGPEPIPMKAKENRVVTKPEIEDPNTASGKVNKEAIDKTVIAKPIYVQAEPVEGYPALYDYFEKNLVYPREGIKDRVEGVVDVSFVIDTTGKAGNVTVENSLGDVFDKEVIRLMENMPQWRPASYNGKAVRSKISLPITFSIKKI